MMKFAPAESTVIAHAGVEVENPAVEVQVTELGLITKTV
jgi:hypothetical protein